MTLLGSCLFDHAGKRFLEKKQTWNGKKIGFKKTAINHSPSSSDKQWKPLLNFSIRYRLICDSPKSHIEGLTANVTINREVMKTKRLKENSIGAVALVVRHEETQTRPSFSLCTHKTHTGDGGHLPVKVRSLKMNFTLLAPWIWISQPPEYEKWICF